MCSFFQLKFSCLICEWIFWCYDFLLSLPREGFRQRVWCTGTKIQPNISTSSTWTGYYSICNQIQAIWIRSTWQEEKATKGFFDCVLYNARILIISRHRKRHVVHRKSVQSAQRKQAWNGLIPNAYFSQSKGGHRLSIRSNTQTNAMYRINAHEIDCVPEKEETAYQWILKGKFIFILRHN